MSSRFFVRREFADTQVSTQGHAAVRLRADPLAQMEWADRADWTLLRLVLCAAGATLVLALACSLAV